MVLWYLRSLLGLASAVFALLSPLCVIHWLCRISPNSKLQQLVSVLDPVFLPFVKTLNHVIPASWFQMLGHEADIGQGVLSALLTLGVIVTAFMGNLLRVAETKSKVQQDRKAQQRLMRETLARRMQAEQPTQQNQRLVLLLKHVDPAQASAVVQHVKQTPCDILFESDDKTVLLFPSVESGLKTASDTLASISVRLKQLRPMDARPDYRFVLHAIDDHTHPQEALAMCQRLEPFCQSANMLCTQNVSDVIRFKKIPYELTSLGYYDIAEMQRMVELFKVQAG